MMHRLNILRKKVASHSKYSKPVGSIVTCPMFLQKRLNCVLKSFQVIIAKQLDFFVFGTVVYIGFCEEEDRHVELSQPFINFWLTNVAAIIVISADPSSFIDSVNGWLVAM